ncbi:peptidoglycan DD-metalloendopeptidase family protein [Caballeronia sp. BR00000012568055]|uniref:peptidoglycan DD-metalloendopeptidase family protein n=1 Tax=Caballeronia sp. BR00000012568055 TaxID=2918761 RepID=UPI0023F708E9|nr:peptidoglycan DD-metalloendopeptidase family protein [Caballeronia sp. BR00000012568055]
MPLSALAVPATRFGKTVLAGAIGSAVAALMLTSLKPVSHSDDDTPPAITPARVAETPKPPPAPPQPRTESVTIDSTFAEAMQRSGFDAATTDLLARSFSGQIDFRRDLRKGDTVSFVMEPQPAQPEPLAVRVSRGDNDGDHDLFLHRDLNGKPFYYTANGKSGAPSFSRYPLAFTRVSSDFSMRRFDPVVHRWQSHDGVDFAAPIGTPVHATARGTISFIGWETGYGKFIVIDNPPPYQTAFAHLSRFAKGLHRGSHVRRGQVIGYVGRTGWATGPHLHYEVRIDDIAQNPLTVALPGDAPLHGPERTRFAQEAQRLADLL